MKTRLTFLLLLIFPFLLSSCANTEGGSNTPVNKPATTRGSDYRNSKAEVVVLNFFDMYCHECQKDAPHINALFSRVQQKGLGSKIDFYAIGWSNTPLESEMYRKRFNVRYSIIPDRDRSISRRFGKFRPPLLIALRKQGGQWKEFYRIQKIQGKTEVVLSHINP